MPRTLPILLLTLALSASTRADSPTTQPSLDGAWLPESALCNSYSQLPRGWHSLLTLQGNAFSISNFDDAAIPLTGTFTPDPAGPAHAITLAFNAFKDGDEGLDIPTHARPALLRYDHDTLTLALSLSARPELPKDFSPAGYDTLVLTFTRAPKDFTRFPATIVYSLVDEHQQPLPGATLHAFFRIFRDPDTHTRGPLFSGKFPPADATGHISLPYDTFKYHQPLARSADGKLLALAELSPASLHSGRSTLTLRSAITVSGTVKSSSPSTPPPDTSGVLVYAHGQQWAAIQADDEGRFSFPVPPGVHTFETELPHHWSHPVTITLPDNQPTFTLPPITADPSLPVGQPAPELHDVRAWYGTKTTFADLKGKVVLLDFWGYWCGPCVAQMPALFKLHDQYAKRGLAIVTVHVDPRARVDSLDSLQPHLDRFKQNQWNGRDLPFPTALAAGTVPNPHTGRQVDSTPALQYGIEHFPTTILIAPNGTIVGCIDPSNESETTTTLEKLLPR